MGGKPNSKKGKLSLKDRVEITGCCMGILLICSPILWFVGLGVNEYIDDLNWEKEVKRQEEVKANTPAGRKKAEAAQKEIEAQHQKELNCGPKPSDFDIKYMVKQMVNDPDSLVFEDTYISPVTSVYQGQDCWNIRLNVRAKNGFGGYIRTRLVLYVRNGSLLGYTET